MQPQLLLSGLSNSVFQGWTCLFQSPVAGRRTLAFQGKECTEPIHLENASVQAAYDTDSSSCIPFNSCKSWSEILTRSADKSLPEQITLKVDVSEVATKALLSRDCRDLKHPGGWIDALLQLWYALDAFKVLDQVSRVLTRSAIVDDLAAPLQKQELIKRL